MNELVSHPDREVSVLDTLAPNRLLSTPHTPATDRADVQTPTLAASDTPDWSRERGLRWHDPGPRILSALRRYQYWRHRLGPIGRVIARFYALQHRFWSVLGAAEIPLNSNIAGGLRINHPNGIVIHPCARIGPNCLILQQVTIGEASAPGQLPTIGANVMIGAGAKILGGITIGDHARIGANAVVLSDVPPHHTAVGIPARILPPKTPAASTNPKPLTTDY